MSFPALVLLGALTGLQGVSVITGTEVQLAEGDAHYRIDTATLAVDRMLPDGPPVPLMLPVETTGTVDALEASAARASWQWPETGLAFLVRIEHESLVLQVTSDEPSELDWPLASPAAAEWAVPDGQGMILPAGHADLAGCRAGSGALSYPAWAYLTAAHSGAYALSDGLQAEICWPEDAAGAVRLHYTFAPDTPALELALSAGPADPLAAARLYRERLQMRGGLITFADKQPATAPLDRLFGASHAYIWGDGRSPAFLDDLEAAGIARILLAYEADGWDEALRPAYLAAADAAGWLAGPYESFANAQPSGEADTVTADWGDLFPQGCIVGEDGARHTGFAGRGCELSSEALRRREGAPNVASRYAGHASAGARHAFLDVDAFGSFYADHHPDHPMDRVRDRQNRLERMRSAIDDHDLVLGSEHVGGWAHGVTHYSHGGNSANLDAIWPLLRQRERFGGYWPEDRPRRYFQPAELTDAETEALFSPARRLPLFEAAFHDAMISTDRWEFGQAKFPALAPRRFALALLYGTPTLWHLDRRELARIAPQLRAAETAFREVHGTDAPAAMTGFEWVSNDRLVQRTSFADGLTVIANFSDAFRDGLEPDCVRAERDGESQIVCPPN